MTRQTDQQHNATDTTGDDPHEPGSLPSQAGGAIRHQQQIRMRRTRARRVMQLNRRR